MLDYTSRRPPWRSRFAASPACRWKGQRGWWRWRARADVRGGSDSAVPPCPWHVRSTLNICR